MICLTQIRLTLPWSLLIRHHLTSLVPLSSIRETPKKMKHFLTWGLLALRPLVTAAPTPDQEEDDTPLPLVIWHGLGDTYNSEGMQYVASLAEAQHPGIFVHTIQLGDDANADRSATFIGNVTTQLETVCAELAAHPILSTAPAIDAIGFSQGGQFLRGYIERCNRPPVRSLMTFGSQHNGIVRFRACADRDFLCHGAMALLRFNTWSSFVQARLVPAQYFRDPSPDQFPRYLENSNFLADINNEREEKNATYAANMARLENFVMYMFEDDTTVIPKETAWFEEVNGTEVVPLRARQLYREDWLGLRALDRKGGLRFRQIPGDHMQIGEEVLNSTFAEFLGPAGKKFAVEKEGAADGLVFEELQIVIF
ncbi:palmitoyl-protein thioesterase [Sodiomyces alkalinus F11]|uniref:Palmitoyl-protein thioesterase 1 n=1 Tax=Sodiomyces alkalinus (strain CBS 110278 / VKM F-3762 / F11) TaxID=1314773 RepID=A0A3N2Q8H2_SODAK|nr:palmitoyl-protein thioesterase [Sodiomyces alkalinus F11]ROT43036.1 palmitoyl-protein thioesterase [Sodiomyces alkalinus F11]